MSPPPLQFDLFDAFARPGCPVCQLVLHAVDHAIESINYEFVNDPGFHREVDETWGFCSAHAELWLTRAHPLGTAILFRSVLDRTSAALVHLQSRAPRGILAHISSRIGAGESDAGQSLVPPGRCPFCRRRAEYERSCIDQLLRGFADPAFRAAYQGSIGLCLPHLRQALAATTNAEAFDLLRSHALEEERRLQDQLQEIIRKYDYRFQAEPLGEERGSVERAVRHVAAAPGILNRPHDDAG